MTVYSMLTTMQPAISLVAKAGIDLYLFLVCLRVACAWANVYSTNPLFAAITRVTSPFLKVFYRLIPRINGFDPAAIMALLSLSMLKIAGLFWSQTGYMPPLLGLSVLAFAQIFKQFIDIISLMLLLFHVTSWFQPTMTPALEIVFKITRPFLNVTRKIVPPVAGIDFSGFFVLIALGLVTNFLTAPLMHTGMTLIQVVNIYKA